MKRTGPITGSMNKAFTVIELVVVIAVIGILTAIGIVGYGAWQSDARTNQVKSDLRMAATAMEDALVFSDGYPTNLNGIFKASDGVALTGGGESGGASFCISASSQKSTAINYYIYSMRGETADIQPGSCSSRLAAPTGLAASMTSANAATAAWGAVSQATSYRIQGASNASFTRGVVTLDVTPRSTAVSGLEGSSVLYFRVKALAAGKEGVWSEVVSVAGPGATDMFNSLAFTQLFSAGSRSWKYTTMSKSGTYMAGVVSNTVFVSRNGGSSWSQSPVETARIDGISSSEDGSRLIVGMEYAGPQAGDRKVRISTDYGQSWHVGPLEDMSYISLSKDGSKIAVVGLGQGGNSTQSRQSLDAGATWRSAALPPSATAFSPYSILVTPDAKRFFVSWCNWSSCSAKYFSTTANDGATWSNVASMGSAQQIASSYDGSVLLKTVFGGLLYKSTNFGASWAPATSMGASQWSGVASSYDGARLVAVKANGYLYTSIDSGATWVERTSEGTGWKSVSITPDGTKIFGAKGNYLYVGKFGS